MGEVGVTAEVIFCDSLLPLRLNTDEMSQLVSTLLMAAISGPERAKYLGAIPQRFDPSVMSGLQQIIEERLAKIKSNKEALENNSRTPFDSELEFEQSMGSLLQSKTALEGENKRLKRKIEGMQGNMDRLQENHDQLREDYRMIEAQIDEVASRGDTKSMIDALRKDLQDREDHIASQEASLETSRVAKEKAQYEVEGLKAAADELIVAKDELRSVNRENAKLLKSNTDLEKKANMADHYRRKLETVRDYEGECAELKRINDELQEQCKDVARLRHQNRVHERRIEDFERALSTNESEIYELTMAKKTLADTNVHLHNKVSSLEFTINQIEESRNEMSPQADRQFGSLEDELAENKQEESDTMRIAALKAQVEVLKNNSSAAQENGTLRLKIDNLEHANKKLTEKGNEQFERLAVAEQQVRAILDKSTGEGLVLGINSALTIGELSILTPEYYRTEAFTNLRKTFESVSEALATLQKQHDEAKTELEQVKRDLLDARTDCKLLITIRMLNANLFLVSAIEQEDIEALEALKNTQETLSFSLQNELKDLQQRYKNLDTDYQQQKSQLIDALLSKDELHKKQIEEQEDIAMAKRHKDGLAEQQRLVDDIKLKNEEVSRKKKKSHSPPPSVRGGPLSKLRNSLVSFTGWTDKKSPAKPVLPRGSKTTQSSLRTNARSLNTLPELEVRGSLHKTKVQDPELAAELAMFNNSRPNFELDPAVLPLPLPPVHYRS